MFRKPELFPSGGRKMNRILSLVRRCVEDYEMIAPNDRIAVGVSGGKDH